MTTPMLRAVELQGSPDSEQRHAHAIDATAGMDVDLDAVIRDVTARGLDLRGLLSRSVTQARQVVRLLLEGRLVCQPLEEAAERGYTFAGTGTYGRLGVKTLEPCNLGGDPGGI